MTEGISKDKKEPENRESLIGFKIYSSDNIPSQDIAEGISTLFLSNYPEMYPEALRQSDLVRYDSSEKIQKQIMDGNFFVVADISNKVIGISKFRIEQRSNKPNHEEWLESWIIVDKPHRKEGVGGVLLDESIVVIKKMKSQDKVVSVIADVMSDNKASVKLFKKQGWIEETGKAPGYLLFRKEV